MPTSYNSQFAQLSITATVMASCAALGSAAQINPGPEPR